MDPKVLAPVSVYSNAANTVPEAVENQRVEVGQRGKPSSAWKSESNFNAACGKIKRDCSPATCEPKLEPSKASSAAVPTNQPVSATTTKPRPSANLIAPPRLDPKFTPTPPKNCSERDSATEKFTENPQTATANGICGNFTPPGVTKLPKPIELSRTETKDSAMPTRNISGAIPDSKTGASRTTGTMDTLDVDLRQELAFDYRTKFNNHEARSLQRALEKGKQLLSCIESVVQGSGEAVTDVILQQIKDIREKAVIPKTIIGVIGDTGTGKSTLINAILEEDRLVPTNCMRACTSVVTEIAYNTLSSDRYLAHVEFISMREWEEELEDLFARITSADDDDGSLDSESGDTAIAIAKLKAIFPHETISVQQIKAKTISPFLEDQTVSKLLEKGTVVLSDSNSKSFYERLQNYIDSSLEKAINKATDSHGISSSVGYWPIIKVVKIFLKSKVLKSGAILVDLPGTKDSNAARNAVASRYLLQCNSIWIVSPIHRATSDRSALSLLGKLHDRHQLYIYGTLQTATYICTKSDDLGILNDAISSLSLEKEATEIREKAEIQRQRIKVAAQEIQAAETNRKGLELQLKAWKEKKKSCDEHLKRDTAERIHSTRAATSRSRIVGLETRNTKDLEPKTRPAVRRSARHSSSTGIGTIKNATTRGTIRELEEKKALNNGSTPKQIATLFSKCKEEITTCKQKHHVINEFILRRRKEITALKIQLKEAECELESMCIRARNNLSKERIRQNFALELRELKARNPQDSGDPRGSNSTTTTLVPGDNDLQGERILPVFCVSSRAYQNFRNLGKSTREKGMTRLSDLQQTEIPQLQQHCRKSTDTNTRITALKFMNSLDQLLNLLARWILKNGDDVFGKRRLEVANHAVEEMLLLLREELGGCASSVSVSSLKQSEARLYKAFSAAVEIATEEVERQTKDVAQIKSFHTYKAIFRKKGVHTNRWGVSYNVNNAISEPFTRTISSPWHEFFETQIPRAIGNREEIENIFATRISLLWPTLEGLGLADADKAFIDRSIKNLSNKILSDREDVTKTLKSQQRKLSRSAESEVQKELSKTYKELRKICGHGATSSMRTGIQDALEAKKESIFKKTASIIQEKLVQLIEDVERKFTEALEEAIEKLQSHLYNLCESARQARISSGAKIGEERSMLKLEVENLLRSGREDINQLIEKPRDTDFGESEEEDENEEEDKQEAFGLSLSEFDFGAEFEDFMDLDFGMFE